MDGYCCSWIRYNLLLGCRCFDQNRNVGDPWHPLRFEQATRTTDHQSNEIDRVSSNNLPTYLERLPLQRSSENLQRRDLTSQWLDSPDESRRATFLWTAKTVSPEHGRTWTIWSENGYDLTVHPSKTTNNLAPADIDLTRGITRLYAVDLLPPPETPLLGRHDPNWDTFLKHIPQQFRGVAPPPSSIVHVSRVFWILTP